LLQLKGLRVFLPEISPVVRPYLAEKSSAIFLDLIKQATNFPPSSRLYGEILDTQNERDIRTVSKAMRGSGWMTKTKLARGLKSLNRRVRTDLIKDLMEQQKIETRQVETGGRPSTQFKWMNN
jgi:hypothetical protein